MEKKIKRGDMFFADLNPVIGSEQGGTRPVIVIQNDIGNRHSFTVIVAIITSKIESKAKMPTHCRIKKKYGLEMDSMISLEQIRTIDKSRLGDYVGALNTRKMRDIDRALIVSMGLKQGGVTDAGKR